MWAKVTNIHHLQRPSVNWRRVTNTCMAVLYDTESDHRVKEPFMILVFNGDWENFGTMLWPALVSLQMLCAQVLQSA